MTWKPGVVNMCMLRHSAAPLIRRDSSPRPDLRLLDAHTPGRQDRDEPEKTAKDEAGGFYRGDRVLA